MDHVVSISDNPLHSSYDSSNAGSRTRLDSDVRTSSSEGAVIRDDKSSPLPSPNDRRDSYVPTRCGYVTDTVKGFLVRTSLIIGNLLAAWRAVVMIGDYWQWGLSALCIVLLLVEFLFVAIKRQGREWKWWSPCFLVYLATTLPSVWRIQLFQQEEYVRELETARTKFQSQVSATFNPTCNNATGNCTDSNIIITTTNQPISPTTNDFLTWDEVSIFTIINLSDEVWVICINESIIYLIIIGRWFLPRGTISREFLADLLLEFLAIASDIMELLAIFDIGAIRGLRNLNYVILTVWSISFIQFLPMLMHKRKYKPITSIHLEFLTTHCGVHFIEIISTVMGIFLQDGPFLAVRLYIMIQLNIVTYSLTFFMLKNACTLVLLFYRLMILSHKAPCCKRTIYTTE